MSPADQASIMTSRQSTADANLRALSNERLSREKLAGSATENVADFYKTTEDKRQFDLQNASDNEYKRRMASIEEEKLKLEKQKNGELFYTDPKGNLQPVDKTKVISDGQNTYDF
jgi:hypothetical protein